ncbi:hypothetical protein [uncultured Eubacterium sp.]|uniref:fibronectin type III domain-containing protein n=1 Tax=uncultured Eubacterium sp. TaxID=165185 RepID=UPI0026716E4F|nr:hypothetical protein [uncultured Eubacterium sp.]
MRKVFKKMITGVMSIALVSSLLIGVSTVSTSVKAEDTAALTPWVVYSAGQIGRSADPNGWPIRYYNSFATTAGESKTNWDANFPNKQYVDGGEETWTTTKVADGFTANIANTGWDGDDWVGDAPTKDNPYMLRAWMPSIKLNEGHFYTVTFEAKWVKGGENADKAPEKNILVLANDGNTNNVVNKVVTIKSGETVSVETDQFGAYGTDSMELSINMGAFLASYNAGLTTEDKAASGVLTISNVKIHDKGLDPNYDFPPERPDNPTAPTEEVTTKKVTPTQPPVKPTVKKLAKVKKLKAKNSKKGTVKITWRKVSKAKKYQIKVGKKTYTTKKAKYTVKKLKKGKKYTIKVRATASGYKASAWAKTKVKVKK